MGFKNYIQIVLNEDRDDKGDDTIILTPLEHGVNIKLTSRRHDNWVESYIPYFIIDNLKDLSNSWCKLKIKSSTENE